jgi:hypothetical protein
MLKLRLDLLFSRLTLKDIQQCLLSEFLLLAIVLVIIHEVPPLQLNILQSVVSVRRCPLYGHPCRGLLESLCH